MIFDIGFAKTGSKTWHNVILHFQLLFPDRSSDRAHKVGYVKEKIFIGRTKWFFEMIFFHALKWDGCLPCTHCWSCWRRQHGRFLSLAGGCTSHWIETPRNKFLMKNKKYWINFFDKNTTAMINFSFVQEKESEERKRDKFLSSSANFSVSAKQ